MDNTRPVDDILADLLSLEDVSNDQRHSAPCNAYLMRYVLPYWLASAVSAMARHSCATGSKIQVAMQPMQPQ
jgi:hypothetical protein